MLFRIPLLQFLLPLMNRTMGNLNKDLAGGTEHVKRLSKNEFLLQCYQWGRAASRLIRLTAARIRLDQIRSTNYFIIAAPSQRQFWGINVKCTSAIGFSMKPCNCISLLGNDQTNWVYTCKIDDQGGGLPKL